MSNLLVIYPFIKISVKKDNSYMLNKITWKNQNNDLWKMTFRTNLQRKNIFNPKFLLDSFYPIVIFRR